jgi:hypothetical protein
MSPFYILSTLLSNFIFHALHLTLLFHVFFSYFFQRIVFIKLMLRLKKMNRRPNILKRSKPNAEHVDRTFNISGRQAASEQDTFIHSTLLKKFQEVIKDKNRVSGFSTMLKMQLEGKVITAFDVCLKIQEYVQSEECIGMVNWRYEHDEEVMEHNLSYIRKV